MSDATTDDDGLQPEDFGEPLSDPAGLDPRAGRRRRLRWSLVLLVVGAVLGGGLGWSSTVPLYRGWGLIHIAPSMPSPEDPGGTQVLPMYEGFVSYQVNLLESRRATLLAMDTDEWKPTVESEDPNPADRFEAQRQILHQRGTQHIEVAFVDPDSGIALAGVRALIDAYLKLSEDLNGANESLDYARSQADVLTDRLAGAGEELSVITDPYGGEEGLAIRHRAKVERVLVVEEELRALQDEIELHSESRSLGPRVEALRVKEAVMQKRLEHLLAESRKLGTVRVRIEQMRAKMARLERKLEQMVALRNQLTSQLMGKGRVTIADSGTLPTECHQDDREKMAKTWAGFGALPGLLAVLATIWSARRSARKRRTE